METITLKGSWVIRAPRAKVHEVVTDFARMPERFPRVAKEVRIVSRDGDRLEIKAVARTFGRNIGVRMHTKIRPNEGFVSDNVSEMGTEGHEEFVLRDHPDGTRIDYTYEVRLKTRFWKLFAGPLIGRYALRFWEKHYIDRLRALVEDKKSAA